MRAGKFDIVIEQGSTYTKRVQWKDASGNPVSLSGFTFLLNIKNDKKATDLLIATELIGLTAIAGQGILDIEISASTTAALDFDHAVYDLTFISSTAKYRILEGAVILSRSV